MRRKLITFGAKRRTEGIIRVRIRGVIRIPVTIRVHIRDIRRIITNRAEPVNPKENTA